SSCPMLAARRNRRRFSRTRAGSSPHLAPRLSEAYAAPDTPPARVEKPCTNGAGTIGERKSGTRSRMWPDTLPRFAQGGERGRKVGGRRGGKLEPRASRGMLERQPARMQRRSAQHARDLPGAWIARRPAVRGIAQHRAAVVTAVDADLMGATGEERQLQQSGRAPGQPLEGRVAGQGRLAGAHPPPEFLAVPALAAVQPSPLAGGRGGRRRDQGQVAPPEPGRLEQSLQAHHPWLVPCPHPPAP